MRKATAVLRKSIQELKPIDEDNESSFQFPDAIQRVLLINNVVNGIKSLGEAQINAEWEELVRIHTSSIEMAIPSPWIPLALALDLLLRELAPDYKVLQIKQKLSSMRYYIQIPDGCTNSTEIRRLCAYVESMTEITCSICGRLTSRSDNYFKLAVCKGCNENQR